MSHGFTIAGADTVASSNNFTIAGPIVFASGGLSMSGAGTVTFGGPTATTGNFGDTLTVNAGTLGFAAAAGSTYNVTTLNVNGGTLAVAGATGSLCNVATLNVGTSGNATAVVGGNGKLSVSGNMQVGYEDRQSNMTINGSGSVSVAGTVYVGYFGGVPGSDSHLVIDAGDYGRRQPHRRRFVVRRLAVGQRRHDGIGQPVRHSERRRRDRKPRYPCDRRQGWTGCLESRGRRDHRYEYSRPRSVRHRPVALRFRRRLRHPESRRWNIPAPLVLDRFQSQRRHRRFCPGRRELQRRHLAGDKLGGQQHLLRHNRHCQHRDLERPGRRRP